MAFFAKPNGVSMNAPHFHSQAKSAMMERPLAAFLDHASLEITPKQIEKLALLKANFKTGSRVFIALIDPAEVELQIVAAKTLIEAGFIAIPHVPARFVRDEHDL